MTDEEIVDAKNFFKKQLILPLLFFILMSISIVIDVYLTFKIIAHGGSFQWFSGVLLILIILLLLCTLDNKGLGMLFGMHRNAVQITETYIIEKREYRSMGNYFSNYYLCVFLSYENAEKEHYIRVSKAVYNGMERDSATRVLWNKKAFTKRFDILPF